MGIVRLYRRCASPAVCRSVLLAWVLLFAGAQASAQEAGRTPDTDKQVLLLLQPGYGRPGVDAYVASFVATWRGLGMPVEKVYVEYLDLARNPDPAYRKLSRELLLHKYANRPLDLIVTFQQTPLNFLLEELPTLSPMAPVIASNASLSAERALQSGRRFLRQDVSFDYAGTLDIALKLFPATAKVLVLGGTGVPDLAARREIEALAPRWQGRLQFEYTNELSYEQILQRLAQLQAGTIVLRTTFNRDAAGKAFSSADVGVAFSRVTSVPTFYLFDTKFGIESSVGGMMYAIGAEGERASRLGHDIVQDRLQLQEAVTPLPSRSVPMFDWAQLERWGAHTSALPPDSVIINRPRSLYEEHRTLVLGTGAALLVLSGMVVVLTLQNRRRRVAEQQARDSEAGVRMLVEHAPEAIVVCDLDTGLCVQANRKAELLFASTREEILRSELLRFFAPDAFQPDGMSVQRFLDTTLATLPRGQHVVQECRVRPVAGGADVLCEMNLLQMPSDRRRQLRVSFVDITERRENEARIHRLAFYDPMTDLPNRRLLMDRMGVALHAAQRSGECTAVLFLDLDHFKNINDASGHAVGDALLQQVAERLRGLLREEDTVARIGGDEFVILLPHVGGDEHEAGLLALGVAEKIRRALQQPVELQNQVYASGCSIGVTLLTSQSRSVDDLLREADTAMYRAKASGRNAIAFYEAAMHAEVQERLALEVDLKHAIGNGQLDLHLQSQVDAGGRTCGAELLLRWQHPVRGFVSPAQFIPVAESTGLILELGHWVLMRGCQMQIQLAAAGHDIPLSINISPRQLREHDFVAQVRRVLAETGAPADKLIFEVTEGHLVEDVEKILVRMNELAALGIRFSIDDFGTGYSSLAYLNRMPLYELKIDRSFVQGLPDDLHARGIVETVLSIARNFSLHVVAEGVETRAQADSLKQSGCPSLQGYLYARPVPLQDWLAQQA
ncbi:EAL domain-containing protein [Bradyrhizobium sp.]|uniref:EAL domain-containing protein n=1 Tax=Bradyrhizobium sp. TaxID=376 RepID=UPI002733A0E9|nr:EAL domain-containing protein [Bradyrhizobium sp.]MDP3690591.1 EAL domain-containing protein [Bradyrhizobium sp.]